MILVDDLSELIQRYKKNPTDALKDELIALVMAKDAARNGGAGEWIEFSNGIRVRRRKSNVFEVVEVYSLPCDQYLCYRYLIDMRDYSTAQLQDCKENNMMYIGETDDAEYFAAMSLAMSRDLNEKDIAYIADGKQNMLNWFKVDKVE